ncbi:uncharacterized protein ATXN1 isoform X1 [Gallus gallus]|uniref:uncharacterized protein ATXN1 isoform X1 n=1 Tax=Gallus gallus TaxID=9031 RepID=UPI001F0328D8|nr:uncharacterized protein ATXN1 isoform X1 [Gallus gallus]
MTRAAPFFFFFFSPSLCNDNPWPATRSPLPRLASPRRRSPSSFFSSSSSSSAGAGVSQSHQLPEQAGREMPGGFRECQIKTSPERERDSDRDGERKQKHWNAEGDSGVNFLLLLQSLSQLWTSRLRISQFYILLQNETAGMDPQYLAKRAVVQYWNRISLAWKAERKNASSGVGGLLEL